MSRIHHVTGLGLCLLLGSAATGPARAGGTEALGTDIAIALPLVAGGVVWNHQDLIGAAELAANGLGTVGTAYGLKHLVHEDRPDHSDDQSFPSDTAALAFAPAQFLWDRYGWSYGLPAYAAAVFVAYSRVDARKHHWYDVTASAGLAFGFSQVFTTTYQDRGLSYGVTPTEGGAFLHASYRF